MWSETTSVGFTMNAKARRNLLSTLTDISFNKKKLVMQWEIGGRRQDQWRA
jgi:hypothetical protein